MILNELILYFIVGGITISVITLLVKYVNNDAGALIWSAPVILLPSIILLYYSNVQTKKIGKFVYISIPYLFLTLLWQITFVILISYNFSFFKSIIISLFVWLIIAVIWYNRKLLLNF